MQFLSFSVLSVFLTERIADFPLLPFRMPIYRNDCLTRLRDISDISDIRVIIFILQTGVFFPCSPALQLGNPNQCLLTPVSALSYPQLTPTRFFF